MRFFIVSAVNNSVNFITEVLILLFARFLVVIAAAVVHLPATLHESCLLIVNVFTFPDQEKGNTFYLE